MPTRTFSGRAEEKKLAYADNLVRRRFGVSFGQYCATILVDAIYDGGDLPEPSKNADKLAKRQRALQGMKELSLEFVNSEVAALDDVEVKELIASRYA
ncbi:MAG: hypothetical protein Q4C36_03915 [Coriobacteriia bacterium]|nr:hypothetical protein [Coriobacteriia bacterium]